jgi:hypothetical protein
MKTTLENLTGLDRWIDQTRVRFACSVREEEGRRGREFQRAILYLSSVAQALGSLGEGNHTDEDAWSNHERHPAPVFQALVHLTEALEAMNPRVTP